MTDKHGLAIVENEGSCGYCGGRKNLSKDHIPPKSLFSTPRPNDLITVPSCKRCNEGSSKDDTYFRDVLVLSQDLAANQMVQPLIKTVLRSFKRMESTKYFWSIYSKFAQHDARTRHGIYVGSQPTLEVDLGRVLRVVKRIVRGLHYHENQVRLSPDYEVNVFTTEHFDYDLNDEQRELFLKEFLIPTLPLPYKTVGNGVFKYKMGHSTNKDCCVWVFLFFDKVPFLSVTLPKSVLREKTTRNVNSYPPGFYE
jgi:hypothetical protein